MGLESFRQHLSHLESVGIDSNILIYYLDGTTRYQELTKALFLQITQGKLTGFLSTLSITESLVTPYQKKDFEKIKLAEQFLHSIPGLMTIAPTYPIAKEASRLRAQYSWKTPDAIIFSTFLHQKASAFMTNDSRFSRAKHEGIAILTLDHYL